RTLRHLLSNEDFPVLPLDGPERDRAEGGRPQCLARAQTEAGMVPRAPHGIVDQQPLGEGPAVMGADGTDSEDLVAPPRQQHAVLAHMSLEHAAIRHAGNRHALRQIGSRLALRRSIHVHLLRWCQLYWPLEDAMKTRTCAGCHRFQAALGAKRNLGWTGRLKEF